MRTIQDLAELGLLTDEDTKFLSVIANKFAFQMPNPVLTVMEALRLVRLQATNNRHEDARPNWQARERELMKFLMHLIQADELAAHMLAHDGTPYSERYMQCDHFGHKFITLPTSITKAEIEAGIEDKVRFIHSDLSYPVNHKLLY